MSERKVRRALLATVPPDEIGAQRRAWRIVRTAYSERVPSPWPVRHKRPLAAASVGVALLVAALSPPGRAVIRDVRDAVGTEKVVGVKQSKPASVLAPGQGTRAGLGAERRLGGLRERFETKPRRL